MANVVVVRVVMTVLARRTVMVVVLVDWTVVIGAGESARTGDLLADASVAEILNIPEALKPTASKARGLVYCMIAMVLGLYGFLWLFWRSGGWEEIGCCGYIA